MTTDEKKLRLADFILGWWFAEELADDPDDVPEFDSGDFVEDVAMAITQLDLTSKDVN